MQSRGGWDAETCGLCDLALELESRLGIFSAALFLGDRRPRRGHTFDIMRRKGSGPRRDRPVRQSKSPGEKALRIILLTPPLLCACNENKAANMDAPRPPSVVQRPPSSTPSTRTSYAKCCLSDLRLPVGDERSSRSPPDASGACVAGEALTGTGGWPSGTRHFHRKVQKLASGG